VGEWSLGVANPGEDPVQAPGTFTVEREGQPNLRAEILGRQQVRAGQRGTYHVVYENVGNIDVTSRYILVHTPEGNLIRPRPEAMARPGIAVPAALWPLEVLPPGSIGVIPFSVDPPPGVDTVNIVLAVSSSAGELGPISYSGESGSGMGQGAEKLPERKRDPSCTPSGAGPFPVYLTIDDVTNAKTLGLITEAQKMKPGLKVACFANMIDDSPEAWLSTALWLGAEGIVTDPIKNPLDGLSLHPDVARAIIDGGNEIGYHGYTHYTSSLGRLPPDLVRADFQRWQQEMDALDPDWRPADGRILARFPGWDASPGVQGEFSGSELVGGYTITDIRLRFSDMLWGFQRQETLDTTADEAVFQAKWHREHYPQDPFVLVVHQDFVTPEDLRYILGRLQDNGFELGDFNKDCTSGCPHYGECSASPPSYLDRIIQSIRVSVIRSISPEDKYGPSGYDKSGLSPDALERWIPGELPVHYRIEFWNKADASASTQDVIVEDQLDSSLDRSSLQFEEIGFLEWKITLDGGPYFNVDVPDVVPLDEDGDGSPDVIDGKELRLVVNVVGTLDSEMGLLRWRFRSLNPLTREPPADPLAGFLPPITDRGTEVGWVAYSINPKAELPSRTRISNLAFVKFDLDAFKPAPACNPGEPDPRPCPFVNTIDSGPPESHVLPFSEEVQTSPSFQVTWEGADEDGGSGVRAFDVWVSTDDGLPVRWLTATEDLSANFAGVPGHRYCFFSIATDNVGHVETQSPPLAFDACTSVLALAFIRGDVNADRNVNIADPVYILQYLFAQGATPGCLDAADVNDDGTINIADPTYLLGYLFAQKAKPLPPFDACGIDPTTDDDESDCAIFSPCEGG
jgi:hypothetical protein